MRTYTVILFQDPDDPRFWIGHVPAVGASSQGDTRDHALEMTQEALELTLEHLIEHGQSLPDDVSDPEMARVQTRDRFEIPHVELHTARVGIQAVVNSAPVNSVAA